MRVAKGQNNRVEDRPLQQTKPRRRASRQIVATLTNRGKARRYVGEKGTIYRAPTKARGKPAKDDGVPIKESLVLFGPGRDDAGHAGVGDKLAHVLIGMNDDAQVHAVHSGIAIDDVNLALEIFRRDC